MRIKDIAHLNKRSGVYALFGDDGHLYLTQADGSPVSVAHLPCISTFGLVKLYVHEPWVCVTERYGTHAALVHLENASVRELSREDYHADVSSYSIGFVERDGRVLLIHQTEWNRLDIMDAETGDCLTGRIVDQQLVEPGQSDEGKWPPKWESANYIDYFHSQLHISPDGEYILSNGWIWHPIGQILFSRTHDFLKRFEQSMFPIDYCHEYSWDRPCAFISNDRFVIAADDARKSNSLDDEDLQSYSYKQLLFYDLKASISENSYGERCLVKERDALCRVLLPDSDGVVHGELNWDGVYNYLVAITPNGTFSINLDGEVLGSHPDCKCTEDNPLSQEQSYDLGWHYSPQSHLVYHWSQENGAIEERRFDCTGH